MTTNIYVIGFFIVINLSLGFAVYSRNKALFANKAFLGVTVFLTAWMVSNFFLSGAGSLELANMLNGASYTFGFIAIYMSLLFALSYPSESAFVRNAKAQTSATMLAVMFALASATPYIAGTVSFSSSGQAVFSSAPLEGLYTVATLLIAAAIVARYILVIRRVRGPERAQVMLVMIALAASITIGVFANLVLPQLKVPIDYAYFSPMTSLVVTCFIAYAITRHGLFDVRPFLARSFAYSLSIGTLLVAFYVLASMAYRYLVGGELTNGQALYFATLSIVMATLYQPTKNYFDKISNRLFYRDSYDPQQVINAINSRLVNSLELDRLLRASAEIIETEMNVSSCKFHLPSKAAARPDSARSSMLAPSKWQELEELARGKWHSLSSGDAELAENQRQKMRELDIGAIVRLRAAQEHVGFMIVGERKSGNAFTSSDVQLLEIVAGEVAIAVQNVLRFEEIQQFNVTLQQKVDEATRKLRATNDKLRLLDETKDEFISMASHQLRTPLTSIKGYLSMVLDGDAGKITKGQEELLKQSFLSSQRMVSLIADLLNLSRLNSGKFVIDATPVDLRNVISSEIMQLRETAKAKSIELVYDSPASFPALQLDETKTHQVVMNFIDNALYYTPVGGRVEVALSETPHHVEFRVKDNGIGVPREQQKHLFTKFYRAENAKRARPDGTGLGIFMAKKVVVAQGGAIIFESEEGKGSTFGFRFNKSKPKP